MSKVFKISLIIAVIAAYMPSRGMMSAYHKVDDSYKQKIEKAHSIPFIEY
jgi:hypothetical protein